MFRNKQNRHALSRSRQKRSGTSYESLESRQLLATVLLGTGGNDVAHVAYVDDTHVDVTINDTVHENVDITDGLRINLGGEVLETLSSISPSGEVSLTFVPGRDYVHIDHRIVGDVGIYGVETVEVDGGDNDVFVRFVPDPAGSTTNGTTIANVAEIENVTVLSSRSPGTTIGNLNGNIKLGGFHRLTTGDGQDTFNINTDFNYSLDVNSGDGDDLFRISASQPDQGPISFANFSLSGEGGDDRFQYRGEAADARMRGGDGNDVVDYTRSTLDVVSVDISRALGLRFSTFAGIGVERMIGAEGKLNSIDASAANESRLSWYVNGNRSRVLDPTNGNSIVFENFTEFKGSQLGIDRFWVLKTAADISILDADEIQISSTLDPLQGNLDSIQHNISIARYLAPHTLISADSDSGPVQVTISDAQGDGATGTFGTSEANRFIAGLTNGGSIRFLRALQPSVTFHGSVTESDRLRIGRGWSNLDINTYGGDDTFFVGSSDGGLQGIDNVSIAAGAGTDRLYANDQGMELGRPDLGSSSARYTLTENSLRRSVLESIFFLEDEDLTVGSSFQNQNTEVAPDLGSGGPLSTLNSISFGTEIAFDSDLEVVRVASTQDNFSDRFSASFTVTPSATTRFIVLGADSVDDSRQQDFLRIQGPLGGFSQLQNGMDPRTGSVAFAGQAQNVFFENLTVLDELFVTPIV